MNFPHIIQGCGRPFKATARIYRTYFKQPVVRGVTYGFRTLVKEPMLALAVRMASGARLVWRPLKAVLSFAGRWLVRLVFKPIYRFILLPAWHVRRPLSGLTALALGGAIIYGGYLVLPMQSQQQALYNDGVGNIRKDFGNKLGWGSFKSPELDLFKKSIMYYNNQAETGLINRLLYGQPDIELAAQAYLKIGTILLYNAGDDEKLQREAKEYLEKAVVLNPGILYARDLIADVSRIDHLAILALAPERNLEWLYEKHPEARSKKPKPGKKDGKGNEDAENGDQKGQPDQPNDQPGDPNDDKKPAEQSPASTNTTLEQNMKDVKNGTANDGI